jgi:hypothetical protein
MFSSIKVWKLAKTRGEKAGLVACYALTLITWAAYAMPFVAAYLAGASALSLVLIAGSIYFLRRATVATALAVGGMMEKRMVNERKDLIEAKLRELFDKARDGKASNVFDMPVAKKAGGLN